MNNETESSKLAGNVIIRNFIIVITSWTVIVAASLSWNIINEKQQTMRLAQKDVLANFNKDQAFRFWGASHGGVYVPITKKTPPNEHLSHIPDRDITIPSGKQLTLMNPAYMVRQMMNDYGELYGARGRIVSLKPFNPNNAPDPWEHKALLAFEQGMQEVQEIAPLDNASYLRMMRPMFIKQSCLKCHASQGYKVGDVRGGVGVSINMQPYLDEEWQAIKTFITSHSLIWLLGITSISIITQRNQQNSRKNIATLKELAELRHYLQNVFDSMPSILVGVNRDGNVTHWNHEAERITNKSIPIVEGALIDTVIPLLSGQMQQVKKAIQERMPQKMERIVHATNGEQQYADIVVYPLVMNAQIGAVIRIDDITERVHIEEMMVQTEKMLSVGGLAAGMAHEINNPLGGILQGQQNIRRRLLPDLKKNIEVAKKYDIDLNNLYGYLQERQIIQFLDDVANAGKRASDIVTNMLQFSRKSNITKEMVNITELIDQVLELASMDYDLKKRYDFRAIEITRDYADPLPLVPCVASEIQQVLLNVIRNAAHAIMTSKQDIIKGHLKVRAQQSTIGIRIDIEDNGHGMDEATRKRIFEPFFTTKQPGQGTGLGMSVSYFIIVETHNGEMQVESEQNKGTKLTIQLPL